MKKKKTLHYATILLIRQQSKEKQLHTDWHMNADRCLSAVPVVSGPSWGCVDQHVSWTGTRSLTGFPLEYWKLSLWGNAGRGSGTAAKNLTRVFAVVGECFTSTSEQIFGASTSRQHFFNVTIFLCQDGPENDLLPPCGFYSWQQWETLWSVYLNHHVTVVSHWNQF